MVEAVPSSKPALATLSYLPAFELAARHLSFKRAAKELHLTPSAVSQQIRALEEALGLELFRRKTRAIELTEVGRHYAALITETLDALRSGTDRLIRQRARRMVRLTTDPFVANEVLIPSLSQLSAVEQGLDLRIETSSSLVDLDNDDVDCAVRYGVGPWRGFASTPVCEVLATAVCAPSLLGGQPIDSPLALLRYPLIQLRDHLDPWVRIAAHLGVEVPSERLVFDSYFACMRAAEKGLGVAFGIFPVVSSLVLEGRLVAPLAMRVRAEAQFHFVCRAADAEHAPFPELCASIRARFDELPAMPERAWITLDEAALRTR
jgi:LysR family glycine cleavage system transcriptional activator